MKIKTSLGEITLKNDVLNPVEEAAKQVALRKLEPKAAKRQGWTCSLRHLGWDNEMIRYRATITSPLSEIIGQVEVSVRKP